LGITRIKWWAGTGLNRRHQDFQCIGRGLTTDRHQSSSSPSQQLSSRCRHPFDRSRLLASDSSGQVPTKSPARLAAPRRGFSILCASASACNREPAGATWPRLGRPEDPSRPPANRPAHRPASRPSPRPSLGRVIGWTVRSLRWTTAWTSAPRRAHSSGGRPPEREGLPDRQNKNIRAVESPRHRRGWRRLLN
jgi:hypothetical protein